MERWHESPEIRLTLVLLAGAVPLVAAGTAGVAASPWLVLGLVALAALLRVLGGRLTLTAWTRVDTSRYVLDLWLGPVAAAVVILASLDASPGEVQALGGLVGLAGMVNYFLRPIYHLLYTLSARYSNG
jgi:hypothetical protein